MLSDHAESSPAAGHLPGVVEPAGDDDLPDPSTRGVVAPHFAIRSTGSRRGLGVFTVVAIPRGAYIVEFRGDLLGRSAVMAYPRAQSDYFKQIGAELYLGRSGDLDDFINHSCSPNCGLHILGGRARLFTLRDLGAGDELTWDYATTSSESYDTFRFDCFCGSENCRGVVSGFTSLDPITKERYRLLGMVPDYLREP